MDSIETNVEDSQRQHFGHLEECQRQLLDQLDDLKRKPILSLTTELVIHELEQEYNRMTDGKKEFIPRKGVDPLDVLPTELVTKIFEMAVLDRICLDSTAPLILVSRRWAYAVCSIPSLWTYIDFNEGDALAKGTIALELSAPLPIEVSIGLSYEDWLHITDRAIAQAGRIKQLYFNTPVKEEGLKMLACFPHLPILHTLAFFDHLNGALPVSELEKMPLLVRAIGVSIPNAGEDVSRWKGGDVISTDQITDAVVDRWSASPALNTLYVEESYTDASFGPLSLRAGFSIQTVTDLSYQAHSPSSGKILLLAILPLLPKLRRISLTSPAAAFLEILGTLHVSTNLQDLDVVVTTETGFWLGASEMEDLLQKPVLHRLSTMQIILSTPFVNPDANETRTENACIYRCLRHFVRSVEYLKLTNASITEDACAFIQGLLDLSSLRLTDCIIESPLLIASKELGKFQWIHPVPYLGASVTFTSPPRSLELAESPPKPNLKNSISDSMPLLQPLRSLSGPQPYEMVRHLIISGYMSSVISLGPLPVLQTLELRQNIYGNREGRHPLWTGDLLELVALRPLDYPHLAELRLLSALFEWDLVFVLLERRNIQVRQEVAPITVICTQRPLPYAIMSPLVSLLHGRFPIRDRLIRYSVEQVGVNLSNASLGCLYCRTCFRSCGCRAYTSNPWPSGTNQTLNSLLPLQTPEIMATYPPLSVDHKNWISQRQNRLRAFQQQYTPFWRLHAQNAKTFDMYVNYNSYFRVTRYDLIEPPFNTVTETGG